MITLKDFNSKQLDFSRLIQFFQIRQDWALNIVIIIATLIAINAVSSSQKSNAQALKSQLSALDKKVQAIKSFDGSQKEFHNFVEAFPTGLGTPDVIIEKINTLAIANGIQIASLGPATREDQNLFIKTSIKATLNTNAYENLVQFSKEIEASPNNLRIDRWSATTKPRTAVLRRQDPVDTADELPPIAVEINIVSIEIKNEN